MIIFNTKKKIMNNSWEEVAVGSKFYYSIVYSNKKANNLYYLQATKYFENSENEKIQCLFEVKSGWDWEFIIDKVITQEEFIELCFRFSIIYDVICDKKFKNLSEFCRMFKIYYRTAYGNDYF